MHELTQMDAQESVKSPRSMSSVHRSTEVATNASSAVGARPLVQREWLQQRMG
jgi:hypothetical protein